MLPNSNSTFSHLLVIDIINFIEKYWLDDIEDVMVYIIVIIL